MCVAVCSLIFDLWSPASNLAPVQAFDISDDDDCASSKPKQQVKQEAPGSSSGSRPSSLVGAAAPAAAAAGAKKMDVDDGIITISDDEDVREVFNAFKRDDGTFTNSRLETLLKSVIFFLLFQTILKVLKVPK